MIPGVIAGIYAPEQALVPLEPLCAAAGFELIVGKVRSVRRKEVEVEVEVEVFEETSTSSSSSSSSPSAPPPPSLLRLSYETLSLDVGSTVAADADAGEFFGGASAAATTKARAIPVRPVGSLLQRMKPFFDSCDAFSSSSPSESSPAPALPRVVVFGAGAGGIEIAAAVAARIGRAAAAKKAAVAANEKEKNENEKEKEKKEPPLVSLVAGPRGLLPDAPSPAAAAALVRRELEGAGVRVVEREKARAAPEKALFRGGGNDDDDDDDEGEGEGEGEGEAGEGEAERLPEADFVFWSTGAAAHPWLRESTDLPLDERGFIRVDSSLRCCGGNEGENDENENDENDDENNNFSSSVFAAGDCASIIVSSSSPPPPKSGVSAVRAGEQVLFPNLLATVLHGEEEKKRKKTEEQTRNKPLALLPARWCPSRQGRPALSLLSLPSSLGSKRAVALWPWKRLPPVAGYWVWLLKDFIDRRWVGGR